MRKTIIVTTALIGALSIVACKSKDGKSTDGTTTIHYELKSDIADSFKKAIATTVGDYNTRYAKGIQKYRELTIRDTIWPVWFNGKDSFTYGAVGGFQRIRINTSAFTIYKHGLSKKDFRDNIAHELYHTFTAEDRTYISDSFILNGRTVIAYHGLCPIFRQKRQRTTLDEGIIDEAGAEALAKMLYPDYASKSPEYRYAGEFMTSIIKANWLTPVDLIIAEQENNLPLIVGMIIKKPVTAVTKDDIAFVVNCFMNAAKSHNIDGGLLEIIDRRGEKGKYKFSS